MNSCNDLNHARFINQSGGSCSIVASLLRRERFFIGGGGRRVGNCSIVVEDMIEVVMGIQCVKGRTWRRNGFFFVHKRRTMFGTVVWCCWEEMVRGVNRGVCVLSEEPSEPMNGADGCFC